VQILALFGEVVSNGDVQMVRMGEKGWEDVSQRQGTNPIVMPKADGGAVPQVDLGTSPEQREQLAKDHPGRSVEAVCVAQVTTNADVDR
jgi:hypothetical protein